MAVIAALPSAYSLQAAARTLCVPVQQVAAWRRSPMLRDGQGAQSSPETRSSVSPGELAAMRRLRDLRKTRVSARTIRRSFDAMRLRVGLLSSLHQSAPLPDGGRLLFRHGNALLDPVTQQFAFDFDAQSRAVTSFPVQAKDSGARQLAHAQDLFQQAVQLEERAETVAAAADLYRETLAVWPSYPAAAINLGTILYNQQRYTEAESCYRSAAQMDPDYALAFFDLGNVLDELQRLPEAIAAYTRALQIVPEYADAHYNLALALERQGERRRALRHWLHYVRLDPVGPWATHARAQFRKTLSSEKLSIVSRHGRLAS